ncbi:hypothetical protein ACFPDS_30605 [Azospirillum lipoferum]|uniref:hypothetical protein n=1 Tax=Azospirillum lipoferum TaxID=193 RepID=UPI0014787713|nr:hypothetical protein [Azospirillum lipoferum]
MRFDPLLIGSRHERLSAVIVAVGVTAEKSVRQGATAGWAAGYSIPRNDEVPSPVIPAMGWMQQSGDAERE